MAFTALEDNFGDSVELHRKPGQEMKYDLIITNYKEAYPTETPAIFIYQQLSPKDIENINEVLFC